MSAQRRKPDFLFPVQALSTVFRGKFMAALTPTHHHGDIVHDPQGDANAWCERQRQLYKHDWVVYATTPLGGPAQVLEYLSRYTHRTAIGNERIRCICGQEVAFTVRVLQGGASAGHCRAAGPGPLANTGRRRGTTEPGATMRRAPVPSSAVQHYGLGVGLRAALDETGTGDKPHWPDTVMAVPGCVRSNGYGQTASQVRS